MPYTRACNWKQIQWQALFLCRLIKYVVITAYMGHKNQTCQYAGFDGITRGKEDMSILKRWILDC